MVQKQSNQPEWDDLAAILAVARGGSIRQAAEALGVSHTTLARRIEAAEGRLGVRAFLRGPRGFVLTEAGRQMLDHLERMDEAADALGRAVAGKDAAPRGRVRVSMPPAVLTHCLMEVLPRFTARYPGIELDFDMRYSFSDLDRNAADIAVRYQEDPPEHLVGTRIGQSLERAYGRADVVAEFAAGRSVPLIAWARGAAFEARAEALGIAGEIGFACVDVQGQAALAEAGLGIAILPTLVGESTGPLMRVNDLAQEIPAPLWILTHPDLSRSARIRAVTGFLAAELRAALARGREG